MNPPPEPSSPLSYAPVPPERRLRPGAVVAWALIIASVAYLAAGRAVFQRLTRPGTPAAAARARPVATAPFQLRLAARYAVGAHNLAGSLVTPRAMPATEPTTGPATAPTTPVTEAAMLKQVDDAAAASGAPVDRLRAAIVAGEVAGADEARARLDRGGPTGAPPGDETAEDVEALRTIYRAGPDSLSAAQRDGLVRRHDWFGRLALAYGKPAGDPARKEAIRPALRTVVAAATAGFLALLALGLGLVLLITGIVLKTSGRLNSAYRPAPPGQVTTPFLEAFAVYLAGMVVLSTAVNLLAAPRPLGSMVIMAALPLAFLWPRLRGIPGVASREGLGWTRGRGWPREVVAGLAAYLAGLPVLAAGAIVTLVLQRISGADTSHPIMNEVGRGGVWNGAFLFFLAAVWAPVVEETMFRGAFYHHLRSRLPWPAAAALVGLLFAAVHPQGWAAVPVLGAIGFCFAAAREWRGSVIAPAVAHALNNGVVTVLLLLMLG